MTEELLKTVEAMETYGGSFIKALAECVRRADHINRPKLLLAFPEYFKEYHEIAMKEEAKHDHI